MQEELVSMDACTWWLNSKVCHGMKQDSAGWEGIPEKKL